MMGRICELSSGGNRSPWISLGRALEGNYE